MDNQVKWVETSGGPIVVSATSKAAKWSGIDGPDYDAACEIFDLTAVVTSDWEGDFLVLGDEPFRTTVLQLSPDNDCIVRWCTADDESSLLKAVREFDLASIEPVEELEWNAGGINCVLFDSSQTMVDADLQLHLTLPQQRVLVRTWDVKPDSETNAILHHFSAFK